MWRVGLFGVFAYIHTLSLFFSVGVWVVLKRCSFRFVNGRVLYLQISLCSLVIVFVMCTRNYQCRMEQHGLCADFPFQSWTKNPVISVQYRMCFVPLCSTVLSTCCFLLTRDRRRLLPLEILHNIPYPSLVTCTTVPPAVTLMLATYYAETQCYREYAPTRTNEGSENPEK